jgi:hypothetical protein
VTPTETSWYFDIPTTARVTSARATLAVTTNGGQTTTSSGTVTITLRNLNDGVLHTTTVARAASEPFTDGNPVTAAIIAPVAGVARVRVGFTNFAVPPGLRTFYVFGNLTPMARASGLGFFLDLLARAESPLALVASLFEPSRAYAEPLDQAQPPPTPSQATLPPAVQTTIAQSQRGPSAPPAPQPTPAVAGPPQAAPALPGPASQPPVVAAPAPTGPPRAPATAPQPAGAQPAAAAQAGARGGRVSFVIVAQVRPGAP